MIAAYYLILAIASNGGIASIPMPSKEACEREVQATITKRKEAKGFEWAAPTYAYCVRANSIE